MEFDGTPLNLTTLLVVALAVTALVFMLRKRYESNVPLLFYVVAVIFTNMTDHGVNPILLYAGFAFTLLLRFEFMNTGFAKLCAFCAASSTGLIILVFLVEVFGDGQTPF
jgi:hypothetical protein